MIKIILSFILLFFCFGLFSLFVSSVNQERNNYRIQGECIANYISSGVERSDIELVGATGCRITSIK
ncbi:hypothetical protein F362_gp04 [Enterobacter phage EcP1]|uniref:Uncharacterized protein n=1 Tax=Enterobacter phage EcP1 TaxID=942016 RepID=E9NIC9_9CAUD|nr:hypothetical protein F362_gp04 [Enterobacter phage EcP1]ADU79155.1 hypothetical protein EcP1_gp04 [Enterobacter phage EcP1]